MISLGRLSARFALFRRYALLVLVAEVCSLGASVAAEPPVPPKTHDSAGADLWALAAENREIHRFSTLFTAQNVRDMVAADHGISDAINWCRKTAVTKVYVESFRDGYQADRSALELVRDRFRAADIEVSGCVTPTKVGKSSTGWKIISCYTDLPTQQRVREIFEFTAGLFDEIMIDDFWFTDCACPDCDSARQAKRVAIGSSSFPVEGDSWADYRCELMVRLSRENVLAASRKVNPRVKVIIKYPQWYDRFHERGYDVLRETADFDRIWVGTETRDYNDPRWGGTPQYEAFFIMRWLGGIGGEKCGGGWFDPYGTTESTYVEQARQTILGGARQSLLFCYGSLQQQTGPKNVEALRSAIPELFEVARQVRQRRPVGVAAYKPADSDPGKEQRVFDFVGMLGVPLIPCYEFPVDSPVGFFSVHALKDPQLAERLEAFLAAAKPALITDGLAAALEGKVKLDRPNVTILPVQANPKRLLDLQQSELDRGRATLLRPLGRRFESPNRVALYLFDDGSWVVENFNDAAVAVRLDGESFDVPARGWKMQWKTK